MAVMVPLVFLINGFTKHEWKAALFFAMAVAVGLTPEMLPMIVSVCLSKGALAMSRKKSDRQTAQLHPELRRHGRVCAPTKPARSPRTGSSSCATAMSPDVKSMKSSWTAT